MKSVIKVHVLFLLIGIFTLASCSKNQLDQESEPAIDLLLKGAPMPNEFKVSVTYYPSVKDAEKEAIRTDYANAGILVSWYQCETDRHTEVWTVLCPECRHDEDVPIKTSSCPDQENSRATGEPEPDTDDDEACDIQRVMPGSNCDSK